MSDIDWTEPGCLEKRWKEMNAKLAAEFKALPEVERLRKTVAFLGRRFMEFKVTGELLRAKSVQRLAALRAVEWGGLATAHECCPGCGNFEPLGHDPVCHLAAAISDLPAPKQEL